MDNELKQLIEEIKKRDIVDYLSSLGHEPAKPPRGNEYWYLSPLPDHQEKTPSFKVDRANNRWYDHGIGKGGNALDLAIAYHDCTVGEFLSMVRKGLFSFHQLPRHEVKTAAEPQPKIEVITDRSIRKWPLLNYLNKRRIDQEVADYFCREVTFRIAEKEYYGIGFKNNSGGWEIRNPYMKAASLPKDITTISNGHPIANVFEGQFDFLSHMTLTKDDPLSKQDFVILNGNALFERARPFLETHQRGHLFLDNGTGGNRLTAYAKSLYPNYGDARDLYKGYKDYNDWHTHPGTQLRPSSKRKL